MAQAATAYHSSSLQAQPSCTSLNPSCTTPSFPYSVAPPQQQLDFDPSLHTAPTIPPAFIWPEAIESNMSKEQQFIEVPTIDLMQFRAAATMHEVAQIAAHASTDIGFFHVVNHGVSRTLIEAVHAHTQSFFDLSLPIKQKARRLPGESFGYASSFTGRFSSRLPWKETFSLQPLPVSNISSLLEKVLGDQQNESSNVFERYSKEMMRVGLEVLEVLGVALGLEKGTLRKFFEPPDNSSILRLNYYPPCQQPGLTFGTGPHADPTGLTLLHQDNVCGLQVLHEGAWFTVCPRPDALVVNIGDTLMALTNGRFKSCVHRALVNNKQVRRSMVFFFNPGFDTTLSAPEQLIDEANPRAFHEFTWAKFLFFTQFVHRSGVNTLHAFNSWLAAEQIT